MQCNSINVVEEPVVITRSSHPSDRELARSPQPPPSKSPSACGDSRGDTGLGVTSAVLPPSFLWMDLSRVCSCFKAPRSFPVWNLVSEETRAGEALQRVRAVAPQLDFTGPPLPSGLSSAALVRVRCFLQEATSGMAQFLSP